MRRVIRGALAVALVAPLSVALTFARPGVAHACSCAYDTVGTQAEQQLATLSTARDSAACGTGFDLKEEYLVFAGTYDTQGAPWSVNMCSATTLSTNELTRAATLKQFGEPRAVTADERAAADYPQGL